MLRTAMSKGEHAAQRWQRLIKRKALTNDKRTLKQALEASLELEPAQGDKS